MRVVLFLFLSLALLQADVYTQKLYETLFGSLFHKSPVFVYADKQTRAALRSSRTIVVVEDCRQSDFLMGSDFENLPAPCHDKPLFATSYKAYKEYSNSFGAFYWRKGRPQIHFNRVNLKKFSIALPENLKKYADE